LQAFSNSITYDSLNGLNLSLYHLNIYWDHLEDPEPYEGTGPTSSFRYASAEIGQNYIIMAAGRGDFYCCAGAITSNVSFAIPYNGENPLIGITGTISPLALKIKYGLFTQIDKMNLKIQFGIGFGI